MNGDSWFDAAACAGDNPYEWDTSTPRARLICRGCPVATECLTWIMEKEAGYSASGRGGLYAGYTPDQRAALARKRPA